MIEVAFTAPDPKFSYAHEVWLVGEMEHLPRVGDSVSITEPNDTETLFQVESVEWDLVAGEVHPDADGWRIQHQRICVRMEKVTE